MLVGLGCRPLQSSPEGDGGVVWDLSGLQLTRPPTPIPCEKAGVPAGPIFWLETNGP